MAPTVLGGGRQLPVGKKTALGKGGQEREEEGQWGWNGQLGQSRVKRARLNTLLSALTIKTLSSASFLMMI